MTKPERPPVSDSARERAYQALRERILDGTFAAGTFIEETQASEVAQVSRTPVREALNRLSVEGLVELIPRRGAMVRPVTMRELVELYEVRRLIEGHAAALLCAQRRGAPARMRELHEAMVALPPGDLRQHVELNRLFHHALVESTGNGKLTRIFADLHTSVLRVASTALSLDTDRQSEIQAEHDRLIAGLDAHDIDAVRAILERHLHPIPELTARLPR